MLKEKEKKKKNNTNEYISILHYFIQEHVCIYNIWNNCNKEILKKKKIIQSIFTYLPPPPASLCHIIADFDILSTIAIFFLFCFIYYLVQRKSDGTIHKTTKL